MMPSPLPFAEVPEVRPNRKLLAKVSVGQRYLRKNHGHLNREHRNQRENP
jgi:hypothetical protein